MANTKIPSELVAINAISGTLIADNAITSVHIAENNITATQIAINAVTALQMADGTITSAKIADGTIVTADIADGQIATAKLADSSVTQAKIGLGAVVASSIANGAITSTQMGANSVSTANVQDNAINLDKMASLSRGSLIYGNSAGNPAYLAAGTSGHVLTSDGTDISWTADTDLFLASSGGTVTGDLILKSDGGDDVINVVHSGNTVKLVSIGQSSDNSGNGVIQLKRNNGVLHAQIHSHGSTYFNGGNVGIGFASGTPQDYLEINGSGNGLGGLTISNSSHNHAALSFARSSTATARIFATEPNATHTGQLNFQTSNASGGSPNLVTAMVIADDQKVGIGQTNPQFDLDVTGLIRATSDVYFQGDVYVDSKIRHNGDVDNYITFSSADTQGFITGNSTRLQITNSLVRFNQENNNQDFSVYSANSDNMLYVDASANAVGIGTSSPGSLLTVHNSSTAGNTQLHIHNNKSGDAAVLLLEGKRTSTNDTGQLLFANNGNNVAKIDARSAADDGELRFFTSASGSGSSMTQRMHISSSGNVGIKNTDPNSTLHIGTGTNSAVTVGSESTPAFQIGGDDNYRLGMYTDNEGGYIQNKNGDNGIIFRTKTAGEVMRLNAGTGVINAWKQINIHTNDGTTNSAVNSLMITNSSTGTTTTGFGGEIRFQAERNNGVIQNTGGIISIAEINAGTNISSGLRFTTSLAGVNANALNISCHGNVTFPKQTTNFENVGFTHHTNNYLYLRGGTAGLIIGDDSGVNTVRVADGSSGYFMVETGNGTERMRILHTGEVHITSAGAPISPTVKHSGATGDVSKLRLINRSGQSSNKGGALELGGVTNDGVDRSDVFVSIAGLKQNATSGDMQGYLQIGVNNGSALDEVVRVSPAGTLFVSNDIGSHSGGAASYAHNTYNHAAVFGRNSTPDGTVVIEDYDVSSGIGNTVLKCFLRDQDPATSATFIDFADAGGRVGSVTHNDDGGGVSFNTTSDYRLKENVNYTWDATTLLKQLKPAKFNFKRNPAKTVQGFLAHEVSSLVPSSVRGNKDHMMDIGTITDSEGTTVYEGVYEHFCKEGQTWTKTGTEPLYQELDYSRLIPLLTKTVQEQQTVIESLTARIVTLEG